MPAVETELDLVALGHRVRALRSAQSMTLASLATAAKLSVSMLSSVERGEKAPTIVVLHRIALALDVSIGRLVVDDSSVPVHVLPSNQQVVLPGPGGWTRRIVSPVVPDIEFEMMETTVPPRMDAGVFDPHADDFHEYLYVLEGTLTLTLDRVEHVLEAGDAIHYEGNCRHAYRNNGTQPCRFVLAMFSAARH
ncbi:MAG: helix-turn-helix transcriptional regulator [Alphaproteobacteria bacterium]|nr:helix-turn-helix transcriptional regulator [Alphaproteobacteria bacterium]